MFVDHEVNSAQLAVELATAIGDYISVDWQPATSEILVGVGIGPMQEPTEPMITVIDAHVPAEVVPWVVGDLDIAIDAMVSFAEVKEVLHAMCDRLGLA